MNSNNKKKEINYSQVGFTQEIESCLNIQKLIDVIHYINKLRMKKKIMIILISRKSDNIQDTFLIKLSNQEYKNTSSSDKEHLFLVFLISVLLFVMYTYFLFFIFTSNLSLL